MKTICIHYPNCDEHYFVRIGWYTARSKDDQKRCRKYGRLFVSPMKCMTIHPHERYGDVYVDDKTLQEDFRLVQRYLNHQKKFKHLYSKQDLNPRVYIIKLSYPQRTTVRKYDDLKKKVFRNETLA